MLIDNGYSDHYQCWSFLSQVYLLYKTPNLQHRHLRWMAIFPSTNPVIGWIDSFLRCHRLQDDSPLLTPEVLFREAVVMLSDGLVDDESATDGYQEWLFIFHGVLLYLGYSFLCLFACLCGIPTCIAMDWRLIGPIFACLLAWTVATTESGATLSEPLR